MPTGPRGSPVDRGAPSAPGDDALDKALEGHCRAKVFQRFRSGAGRGGDAPGGRERISALGLDRGRAGKSGRARRHRMGWGDVAAEKKVPFFSLALVGVSWRPQ